MEKIKEEIEIRKQSALGNLEDEYKELYNMWFYGTIIEVDV